MRRAVTLIAPVAPFRGGIARHSEALARALEECNDADLEVESFARLYPKFLYPGESDRDRSKGDILPFRVRYSLDALNPITWTKAIRRTAERGGIAILPAWTFFVAPALGWLARGLQRRGITVVMMVHNVSDHGSSHWKSHFSNWQLKAADIFVVHTAEMAIQLHEAGHRQPAVTFRHPAYSDFPEAKGALPREYALELLCFGLVRHYKGVDIALHALAKSGLSDVRLTIAGEIWDDGEAIRKTALTFGSNPRVDLIDRYVDDQEAAELFARCDAVLAPYRSVTGSGVAAMARHYCRPIVASDLPGLRELVSPGRTGWLVNADDASSLAEFMNNQVTRESAAGMQSTLSEEARDDEWQELAKLIMDSA